MLPLILALLGALFLLAPILVVVPMSFSTAISFAFPPPGYWLGYYQKFFTSEEWLEPVFNSLVIAVGAMGFTMLLVLPAAFGYVRYRFRGKTLVNLLIMSPLIVPHVVSALAYYGFLGKAKLTGTHLGVIVAHGVLAVPVAFLVISATLKGFDQNLGRAAMSDVKPLTFVYIWLAAMLFLVPLDDPGITINAIWTMGDERTNDVFFDNVFVPDDHVVGDVNSVFQYISEALDLERFTMFTFSCVSLFLLSWWVLKVRATSVRTAFVTGVERGCKGLNGFSTQMPE